MKWLSRCLFMSPVCYGLCLTEKDFHRELKKLKINSKSWPEFIIPGADATTHHLEEGDKFSACCIICIHKSKRPVHQVTSLLTHEAVHVWQRIKQIIGESEPSPEFEAYVIQAITQNLVEAYYKKDDRKNRAL